MAGAPNKRTHSNVSKDSIDNIGDEVEETDLVNEGCADPRMLDLEHQITGRFGLSSRFDELEAQVSDLTNDFCDLKEENRGLREELALLKAVVIKKDKEISDLKDAVVDQKARSMRNNLLLHNIKENTGEDCEELFKGFVQRTTGINTASVKVERAHRIGPVPKGEAKRPRLVVVKLTFYKDRDRILQAWNRSDSATKAKTDYKSFPARITPHFPQEMVEKRALNMQTVSNMKKAAGKTDIQFKLTTDKVYVNNQVVRPKVRKPTADDILDPDKNDKIEVSNLRIGVSSTVSERGSSFVASAWKTPSIDQARMTYRHMLSNPPSAKASHLIMAYRVGNDIGWEDDDEHGAGRFLASWLTRNKIDNTTIFIVRQYGGQHLSTRRFELMREAASQALGIAPSKPQP